LNIVILGSGNVATQLCYNFSQLIDISYQVYSRSPASDELKAISSNIVHDMNKMDAKADIYIICVNDDAIASVSDELYKLKLSDEYVVAHTSGTKPSTLLDQHEHYGVIYPLQTLRKEKLISFKELPLLITANHSKSTDTLNNLAKKLSNHSLICSDEYRSKLHLPAVIVNNFVNHLYHIAQDYCQKQTVEFELLLPLINETISKLNEGGIPKDMQTGPAVREDFKTINAHIEILKKLDIEPEVYETITRSIINSQNRDK